MSFASEIDKLRKQLLDLQSKIRGTSVFIKKLQEDLARVRSSAIEQIDNIKFLKSKTKVPILPEYSKSKQKLRMYQQTEKASDLEIKQLQIALKSMCQTFKVLNNKLDKLKKEQETVRVINMKDFKKKKNVK